MAKKNKGKSAQKQQRIPSDVQGSYTGTGKKGEAPVQDADDL